MGFLSDNNIRFLNRDGERRFIGNYITSATPGILGLHGQGGIGKTVLSWWAADECTRQGIPCAHIDLAHFPFTDSVDILQEIVQQLGSGREFLGFREMLSGYLNLFQTRFQSIQAHSHIPKGSLLQGRNRVITAFIQGIEQLAARQGAGLIFDNLEVIERADREVLETEIFAPLSVLPQIRLFVVSRSQIQWRDPALDRLYSVLHLPPFDDDSARSLTCQVWPELLQRDAYMRALKVSRGHPYSVMRLAKAGVRYFDLDDDTLYERLLEELWTNVIARFMLRGVSTTLQGLLSQMSIVRFFDLSGMRYFSRRSDLFTDTRPSRFIEVMDVLNHNVSAIHFDEIRKGYQLQPPIRPVSLELHRLSESLDTLNEAALQFYSNSLEHLPPGFDEWRRCIIEITYHQAVIARKNEEAKTLLARALAQLRTLKDLEAAFKLRDELGGDRDLPSSIWYDVFTFFEDQTINGAAA
jgi:hypothetical protein